MSKNSTYYLNQSTNEPDDDVINYFEPVYDGCLIAACVAVICVNMLVLVLYSKRRQLRTKTNTLLVSLATSDLLMGLCGIPLYVACNAFMEEHVCTAQGVVFRFTAVSTMFHILAITGERYVYVLHPMQYITIVTGKRILRVISCMWAISLFVALIQLSWVLPFGYFSDNAIKFTSSLVYNCVGLTACFAIPFIIMVIVYCKMFITIRRQVQKIKRQSEHLGDVTSMCSSHRQSRALFIFILMLALFAGSWVTWYISIFQLYADISLFTEKSMVVFDFLRVGVSLINPLLYTFLKSDFREAFMSVLKRKRTNLEVCASPTTAMTSHGKQRHIIFDLTERSQDPYIAMV